MFSLARGYILITQNLLVNNMVGWAVVGCCLAAQGYQESNVPKLKVNGQILGAAEFDNTFAWDNKHSGARILVSKVSILHCTVNKTINIMFSNL